MRAGESFAIGAQTVWGFAAVHGGGWCEPDGVERRRRARETVEHMHVSRYPGKLAIEKDGLDVQTRNYDLELSFAYTGMENLVVGGGYFFHNEKSPNTERDVLNLHASYSIGKALVAGEIISASDTDTNAGEDAYLILLDYDFTDKLGAAIRYSDWETGANANSSQFTIAPNYAITDNLGAILEYSSVNAESSANDQDVLAVELTYTF